MRPNISKFKVYEEPVKDKIWANYADENILMVTHPYTKHWVDLTDPVMQYVSTAMPSLQSKRTPLQDWLRSRNAVREIDADYITWKLRGLGKVTALSVENLIPDNPTPGYLAESFPILLDMETYVVGDILAPVIAKGFQVIVDGLPTAEGQYYQYMVKNVDKNRHSWFPPELLAPNLKWCKIDSAYGEASKGYGSVQFQGMSWIEFESGMHDSGKEFTVTNKAHNLNLKVKAYDDNNKEVIKEQIISVGEAQMLKEIDYEKEMRCYYGRSGGKHLIDETSGYHRRIGPGLEEFMEDGNIIPFHIDEFDIDMLLDRSDQIWFDRIPYNQRIVVYKTGTGGLKMANRSITEKFGNSNVPSDFNTFVSKGGNKYGEGYEGLVYQTAFFTEIQTFPWGRIRFEHWPILDSMELNGSLLHPTTGLPVSSYEFIGFNEGLGDAGGNNVEMLKHRDAEFWTYQCGTWSPRGPIKHGRLGQFQTSGPQRSYTVMWGDTYGLRVKDITLGVWFKPAMTY